MCQVTMPDFLEARRQVRPSAMREIALEVPKVSWDDVGGLQDIKDRLKESVLWPQVHAAQLKQMGVSVSIRLEVLIKIFQDVESMLLLGGGGGQVLLSWWAGPNTKATRAPECGHECMLPIRKRLACLWSSRRYESTLSNTASVYQDKFAGNSVLLEARMHRYLSDRT